MYSAALLFLWLSSALSSFPSQFPPCFVLICVMVNAFPLWNLVSSFFKALLPCIHSNISFHYWFQYFLPHISLGHMKRVFPLPSSHVRIIAEQSLIITVGWFSLCSALSLLSCSLIHTLSLWYLRTHSWNVYNRPVRAPYKCSYFKERKLIFKGFTWCT